MHNPIIEETMLDSNCRHAYGYSGDHFVYDPVNENVDVEYVFCPFCGKQLRYTTEWFKKLLEFKGIDDTMVK